MNRKIISHFQKADPILHRLLSQIGESDIKLSFRHPRSYFRALCREIISQQLSGRVADIFWRRFLGLFPRSTLSPSRLMSLSAATLRQIGISNSKVSYLKNLADFFLNHPESCRHLSDLTDEAVIAELVKIKGIGRWTAEMFCMFTLGRPDVFSAGDQGLKNAIKKHYPKSPDPAIWSPYRTYACLILWKSLEV